MPASYYIQGRTHPLQQSLITPAHPTLSFYTGSGLLRLYAFHVDVSKPIVLFAQTNHLLTIISWDYRCKENNQEEREVEYFH